MNAIDFMIQVEQDGLHLYETLTGEVADAERKEIFELLADAQRRHLDTLQTLKKSIRREDAESETVERARHLENGFRQLLDSPNLMEKLRSDPDGFYHVLKAEEENIRLLEGMAAADHKTTAKAMLHEFAREERAHLKKIENIYEFIEAPHTYLEWGEFANLHPL